MKKAIVLGGTRGIGKAISVGLNSLGYNVIATSRKVLDTSNLSDVEKFIQIHKETDILILNSGGPPEKSFHNITCKDWEKYHKQLFLSFCIFLQKLNINNDGFVFLISSGVIKEPNPNLLLSSSYRLAFSSVFKILSKQFASRNISFITILPGSIDTDRLNNLENRYEFEQTLPMKRLGTPNEIGNFVKSIVKYNIKYLSGTVINFDGAQSNYVL